MLAKGLAGALAATMLLTACGGAGSSQAESTAAEGAESAATEETGEAAATEAGAGERAEGGTVYLGTSDVLGEFFSPYKQGSLASYGWP